MQGRGGPPLPYGAVTYDDFDALLRGEAASAIADEQFIDFAFSRGRVLLQAKAGAGKSSLLLRLAQVARKHSTEIKFLNSSQLTTPARPNENYEDLVGLLGRDVPPEDGRLLILVDGLDELPPPIAQQVLQAAEDVTSRAPNSAVIVADRPIRRYLRPSRWGLAGVSFRQGEDESQEISTTDDHLGAWARLPFYSQLLRAGAVGPGRAELIEAYLASSLGPEADQIPVIASAALAWWQVEPSPRIASEWLYERVGRSLFESLLSSGVIRRSGREGESVEFMHVLVHAYLAAKAVSDDSSAWRRENFEALTLRGGNFDALSLLLAQVGDDEVDVLVRAIDAWNFYAAGYVVSEDQHGSGRVSTELRAALLVLLGLRRFAGVPSTRIQVEDLLRQHGGPLAEQVLGVNAESELVDISRRIHAESDWWPAWLNLINRLGSGVAFDDDIQALASDDGLIAWTAANVLRHCVLEPHQKQRLRGLAQSSEDPATRWRAVHVLGSSTESDDFSLCLGVFENDESRWVRYGALRSAISIISRLPTRGDRLDAFQMLADRAELISADPKWKREVERSVLLDEVPADWPDAVGLLLEALWALAATVDEQDRWRNLSAGLRTSWLPSRVGSV